MSSLTNNRESEIENEIYPELGRVMSRETKAGKTNCTTSRSLESPNQKSHRITPPFLTTTESLATATDRISRKSLAVVSHAHDLTGASLAYLVVRALSQCYCVV